MKKSLLKNIIIAGPTASGKTKLSIDVALKVKGEIINADSMQIYRGLDTLNAMPSSENFKIVPHHLFSFNELEKKYSVSQWLKLASHKTNEINQKGKPAIFVGGSGMYLNAAINGISRIPNINLETKTYLEKLYQDLGKKTFFSKLCDLDPLASKKLVFNDTYRVFRAFEVFLQTGKSIFWWHKQKQTTPILENAKKILIMPSKMELYSRIGRRFDLMISSGAFEEVREVLNKNLKSDLPSMKTLGVKHLINYFKGSIPLEEAIMLAKRDSRRFAKRQLTWFRNSFEPDKIISGIYSGKIEDLSFLYED